MRKFISQVLSEAEACLVLGSGLSAGTPTKLQNLFSTEKVEQYSNGLALVGRVIIYVGVAVPSTAILEHSRGLAGFSVRRQLIAEERIKY